jgi:hypothetical protein
VKTGGPSHGLPIIVGIVILAAFIGIAILADRTWPRRPKAEATTEEMAETREPAAAHSSTEDEPLAIPRASPGS